MATTYDLLILGGGPGGFDAAVEAAGSGLKTALWRLPSSAAPA